MPTIRAAGKAERAARALARHPERLRRVARLYIANRAVPDEVVQDTWLDVIQGIWAFERRSSLKTGSFASLIDRAKTRAAREGRICVHAEPVEIHSRTPFRRSSVLPRLPAPAPEDARVRRMLPGGYHP